MDSSSRLVGHQRTTWPRSVRRSPGYPHNIPRIDYIRSIFRGRRRRAAADDVPPGRTQQRHCPRTRRLRLSASCKRSIISGPCILTIGKFRVWIQYGMPVGLHAITQLFRFHMRETPHIAHVSSVEVLLSELLGDWRVARCAE